MRKRGRGHRPRRLVRLARGIVLLRTLSLSLSSAPCFSSPAPPAFPVVSSPPLPPFLADQPDLVVQSSSSRTQLRSPFHERRVTRRITPRRCNERARDTSPFSSRPLLREVSISRSLSSGCHSRGLRCVAPVAKPISGSLNCHEAFKFLLPVSLLHFLHFPLCTLFLISRVPRSGWL